MNKPQELFIEKIETYKSSENKNFFEQMQSNIKNKLSKCQEYAPHYFTDEFIKDYSKSYIESIKENIYQSELQIKLSEINKKGFIENFLSDAIIDLDKICCNAFASAYFKELGKGNEAKGMQYFNNLLLSNNRNYKKYYASCSEFKTFCDSMSEELKKGFKKQRELDSQILSEFYKWVFIISFFFISIPYFLIKKYALKSYKISTLDEYVNNEMTKEMFIILSKGDKYNYGND